MHISERTAESHVQHILGKLGLPNRTHLARWSVAGDQADQPW
jgi:DNA-binding CsgD family transcriptional regulator